MTPKFLTEMTSEKMLEKFCWKLKFIECFVDFSNLILIKYLFQIDSFASMMALFD